MTDRFEVPASSADILEHSHLVTEMELRADRVDSFPVLIGERVATFHDVSGGYVTPDEEPSLAESYHVINLIHEVQGDGSPPSVEYEPNVEAHIDDAYFYLDVQDVWAYTEGGEDYPNSDYILSLKVTDYQQGKHSFNEELMMEVDKREQEHTFNE